MSQEKLLGRVAIVTGAAQGIGREIAETLARAGVNVVVSDINGEKAQSVADNISALGLKTDVTNEHSVQLMAKKVTDEFRTIHILVNNAGLTLPSLVGDISEEDLEKEKLEIQLLIDDLLDMYEMGDLDSAIFYMYDNQYVVLYKLFTMINNRFLPRFKEIYDKCDELTIKPANFNHLIRNIFFACEPEKRLKSFLELANWTLQELGGRLTEIKK